MSPTKKVAIVIVCTFLIGLGVGTFAGHASSPDAYRMQELYEYQVWKGHQLTEFDRLCKILDEQQQMLMERLRPGESIEKHKCGPVPFPTSTAQ